MLEINKIHLGDSYELIKQIDDKSIDLIYVDIPYLHLTGGRGQSKLAKRATKKKEELSDISNGIDYSIFHEFIRVMKDINCFIWCSRLQVYQILNWFDTNTNSKYEILTWNKTNPMPVTNPTFLSDIEYCLYFYTKQFADEKDYKNKSKFYVSSINQYDKSLYKHPTIKPLNMVKRHILNTTNKNDLILDCFSGSGTTCVACKETNRNFIGIEIDKEYHKISEDRLNGITATGQTSIFTDFN